MMEREGDIKETGGGGPEELERERNKEIQRILERKRDGETEGNGDRHRDLEAQRQKER